MRYYKIYKYILYIELLNDSLHNENRDDIYDKIYAKYTTNKFKIIMIENMITNEILDKIYNYKINDIVEKNIIYFFSKERAFFELDYNFFEETYYPIDKLYYIRFFQDHNMTYNGLHKAWNDSGVIKEIYYHNNGIIL
jgi:hypothetical protein